MSARDWLRNTRGEWYVLGQGALAVLVLLAPIIDGKARSSYPDGVTATVAIGCILIALGFAFAALGALGLGRHVSPFPRPKHDAQLVETGVFAVVRHPIYTGLSLLALGYSLLWASVAALVATVALIIFLDMKSRREERWLEEKFDAYARYKARVRRLVPLIY